MENLRLTNRLIKFLNPEENGNRAIIEKKMLSVVYCKEKRIQLVQLSLMSIVLINFDTTINTIISAIIIGIKCKTNRFKYSLKDLLNPFENKKYGFQIYIIKIVEIKGPHKTPGSPHRDPQIIADTIKITDSVIGAHVS